MSRSRSLPLCAALMICLTHASGASAQPKPSGTPSRSAEEIAGELFDKGNVLYKQSKWAEAEAEFQKAWDVRPSFDVAANLGDCELQIGQMRDAAEHLAYAVKQFPLSGKPALQQRLTARFAEARRQVGGLSIQVNVEAAEVLIDGRAVGRSPLDGEVFIEPGKHAVEAKLEGYAPAQASAAVDKGGSGKVSLTLVKKSAAVAPPSSSGGTSGTAPPGPLGPKEERGPNLAIVGAGAGTAGAALIAGVVFTVLANQKASAAREKNGELVKAMGAGVCAQPDACKEVAGLVRDRVTFSNVAAWSFIGAGALGAATVVYALVNKSAPKTGVRAAPVVTANGGGLSIGGSF